MSILTFIGVTAVILFFTLAIVLWIDHQWGDFIEKDDWK